MSNKNKVITLDAEEIGSAFQLKPFTIMKADIKDGFCNYSYEILGGVNTGDVVTCKGSGIVESDMYDAFAAFSAHMACIDDAFKLSKIKVKDIHEMQSHELSYNYQVSGFRVKGTVDNESIVLVGSKGVSSGGRIELETPKIPLDSTSSYPWREELKEALEAARTEVEMYKAGKFTAVEPEEKFVQKQMEFNPEKDEEFKNAEV